MTKTQTTLQQQDCDKWTGDDDIKTTTTTTKTTKTTKTTTTSKYFF